MTFYLLTAFVLALTGIACVAAVILKRELQAELGRLFDWVEEEL